MTHRTIATLVLLIALATTQALAQTIPVWRTSSDTIAVLSTGTTNGLAYAVVRDSSLRGHNTYAMSVGAHIGKLTIVAIDQFGVTLSNGRVLRNASATQALAPEVALGHH